MWGLRQTNCHRWLSAAVLMTAASLVRLARTFRQVQAEITYQSAGCAVLAAFSLILQGDWVRTAIVMAHAHDVQQAHIRQRQERLLEMIALFVHEGLIRIALPTTELARACTFAFFACLYVVKPEGIC